MAAMIRAVMYARDLITAIGSMPGGAPDGVGSGRVAGVPAGPVGSCELVIDMPLPTKSATMGPVVDGSDDVRPDRARAAATTPLRQHRRDETAVTKPL